MIYRRAGGCRAYACVGILVFCIFGLLFFQISKGLGGYATMDIAQCRTIYLEHGFSNDQQILL